MQPLYSYTLKKAVQTLLNSPGLSAHPLKVQLSHHGRQQDQEVHAPDIPSLQTKKASSPMSLAGQCCVALHARRRFLVATVDGCAVSVVARTTLGRALQRAHLGAQQRAPRRALARALGRAKALPKEEVKAARVLARRLQKESPARTETTLILYTMMCF